ncbi:MAG TPA: MFS transporter, partial [Polyangiaceae bacterium]
MNDQRRPAFNILYLICLCHLFNDMMQSVVVAVYPTLKTTFGLSFTQIGLITLTYQMTASFLQPLVGLYSDYRPTPFSLPGGTLFTLTGMLTLATATSYPMLLVGASIVGMGSSVFHPESSRVARMASGGRPGLAQSLFQVGGNAGSALAPLGAAFVVTRLGQRALAYFAMVALLSTVILTRVGFWYRQRVRTASAARSGKAYSDAPSALVSPRRVFASIVVLLVLIFSKFVYLASLTSYFQFYLIRRFDLSVRSAQFHLFALLAGVAAGTLAGGQLGDRFGRKRVIWFSIIGVLPFTLALPYANLFWTGVLSVVIGLVLASAFPAIVVYGQELMPGRVGMVAGLFFGLSFGAGGLGAAYLGALADATSIDHVYHLC